MACVMLGADSAAARLSGKEREDGGDARPEECSRWPVRGSALKAAGPCVGPCEALRPDSGSWVGPVLVRRGVVQAGEQRRVSPEPEKTACVAGVGEERRMSP